MSRPAPAEEAVRQVAAGDPHADARQWLGPLTVAVAIMFALDTYLVATRPLLPFDVPIAMFVQSFPWGPVTWIFRLINETAGYPQGAVGVIAVITLFIYERRAGYLMALGAVSSLIDNEIKVVMARQRPAADLVHIITPAPGYSYPSGHAVFFTWLSFMLVFALAPHVRPRFRVLLWSAAALVIVLTCFARVWAGAHWPSDVAGGVLLGLGWSAFVIWIPERWLPTPSRKWLSRTNRRRNAARRHRPT
ncbi:MAG TPA: phosphatase PAP2 family protein [Candidatus Dormibacteraeota bacterium]|nr:phosphatase PAP2 family protein [Candidatus Dormibacteraeota bacterium]